MHLKEALGELNLGPSMVRPRCADLTGFGFSKFQIYDSSRGIRDHQTHRRQRINQREHFASVRQRSAQDAEPLRAMGHLPRPWEKRKPPASSQPHKRALTHTVAPHRTCSGGKSANITIQMVNSVFPATALTDPPHSRSGRTQRKGSEYDPAQPNYHRSRNCQKLALDPSRNRKVDQGF
jgi:hypothetical protein